MFMMHLCYIGKSRIASLDAEAYVAGKNIKNALPDVVVCDLAVFGAGGGGLATAVRASDMGVKDIAIFEKTGRFGGNTWMAVGYSAVEIAHMPHPGAKVTLESQVEKAMANGEGVLDEDYVRYYLKNTGRATDWMIDMGLECYYVNDVMHFIQATPDGSRKPHHIGKDPSHGPGYMGSTVCELLESECRKRGIHRVNCVLASTKNFIFFCGSLAASASLYLMLIRGITFKMPSTNGVAPHRRGFTSQT